MVKAVEFAPPGSSGGVLVTIVTATTSVVAYDEVAASVLTQTPFLRYTSGPLCTTNTGNLGLSTEIPATGDDTQV
jgi:hypothetical protein